MNKVILLRNMCYLYFLLILISFFTSLFIPRFEEVGHLQNGCYWRDALIVYIDCNGLPINTIVKFFLNFWLWLIYVPLFTFISIVDFKMKGLPLLAYSIIIWLPMFYIMVSLIKTKFKKSRSQSN